MGYGRQQGKGRRQHRDKRGSGGNRGNQDYSSFTGSSDRDDIATPPGAGRGGGGRRRDDNRKRHGRRDDRPQPQANPDVKWLLEYQSPDGGWVYFQVEPYEDLREATSDARAQLGKGRNMRIVREAPAMDPFVVFSQFEPQGE